MSDYAYFLLILIFETYIRVDRFLQGVLKIYFLISIYVSIDEIKPIKQITSSSEDCMGKGYPHLVNSIPVDEVI